MNLKKHLLAAGLAVTALTGLGEASAHTKMQDAAELPAAALNAGKMHQSDIARKAYWNHYDAIRANAEGSNFTFGDTKLMRNTLLSIAKNPLNYEIFSNLPQTYQIKSAFFRGDGLKGIGGFNDRDKACTYIETGFISSSAPDLKIREKLYGSKGDGVSFELYRIMKHEMIHEWDKTQGRFFEEQKIDKWQRYQAELKIEAHAFAWNAVDEMTYRFVDGFSDIGSSKHLEEFKRADIKAYVKKIQEIEGVSYTEGYQNFVESFQKKLRAGKSLSQAQKEMVGTFVNDFMDAEGTYFSPELKEHYYFQAASAVFGAYKKGNVSLKPNAAAGRKIDNFLVKTYKADVKKLNAAPVLTQILTLFNRAEAVLKAHPDTSSPAYQQEIDQVISEFSKLSSDFYKRRAANATARLSETLKSRETSLPSKNTGASLPRSVLEQKTSRLV